MLKKTSVALLLLLMTSPAFAEVTRIPYDIPYRHQLDTATCWVHCGVATLDLQASEMFGTPVSFSSDALLLDDIRTRALDVFSGFETPWDPGAGMTRLYAMALEHGVVPESVWTSHLSLAEHYDEIFRDVDLVVRTARAAHSPKETFLHALDFVLQKYVGHFPPAEFTFLGQRRTAVDLAKQIINGDSMAYEFRPIPYNAQVFGRVGDMAWTKIISRDGNLIPITSVIAKKTILMERPREALEKAGEIFDRHRPLFLTFITSDESGQSTYGVNGHNEYFVKRPLTAAYAGSHFVLVTGLDRDQTGRINGLFIRDSVTRGPGDERERYMPRDFFETLGKTVHTIGLSCERTLGGF